MPLLANSVTNFRVEDDVESLIRAMDKEMPFTWSKEPRALATLVLGEMHEINRGFFSEAWA